MSTVLRRIAVLLAAAGLAVALGACGNKHSGPVHEAQTEGIYVEVNGLNYQVQTSRQLNPAQPDDRNYLAGVPALESSRQADEVWFAIFMRVANNTDEPHVAATEFEIVDTQENVYEPIELEENPFAYPLDAPLQVAPDDRIPAPNSQAADGPIGGSLLLFKIPVESLGNRPLELFVKSPVNPEEEAVINLDI